MRFDTDKKSAKENEEDNQHDPYAVAVKGHCKGTLPGLQIVGHVPIELSRYVYFAIKHGCSFRVHVLDQTPIRSPLVQGGQEIVCTVTATCILPGIRKLRVLIEQLCSVERNKEDESGAILTDLRKLLERLSITDEGEIEDEDREDTDILTYHDQ